MHLNAEFSNEMQLNQLKDLLYAKAKENSVFTGLMEAVTNEVTIVTAIHNIKSNGGSKTAGVDGKGIDKYLQMPREKVISAIRKALNNYNPKPSRRIYIEKANGKKRPLSIPTISDRIIQECIRIIIEPICEAKFYPHSYGFRPYRSQKHAVRGIINVINGSNKSKEMPVYALEGDIKGCFDNINHRLLRNKLWRMGIHDKRLLKVIDIMLKTGYICDGKTEETHLGAGQGSILSPLLANVYLNDFDWYVGRQYYNPHTQTTLPSSERKRLRYNGIYPKYNFRFADDWVILTTNERETYRLKKALTKYFKYKLKLELSEEKTKITDMRVSGIKFLGFNIIAELSKNFDKRANPKIVAKPIPDYEKLKKKIRNLCEEIHNIKTFTADNCRVAQIEYVNSIILGITNYIKTGVSSKAFNMIDYRVNETMFAVWKRMYPKTYYQMKIPLQELSNLPQRHIGYESKTFAIKYQGKWVGITLAFLTHVKYEKKPFNQRMTPYTQEGRMLFEKYRESNKPLPRERPALYTPEILKMCVYRDDKRNFEYFMNREYAFNRDKGVCRCCKKPLLYEDLKECHHIDNKLPLNKINKVNNLAWVCQQCHKMIHGKEIPVNTDIKVTKKIQSFREKLSK